MGKTKIRGDYWKVSNIGARLLGGTSGEDVNWALHRLGYQDGEPGDWFPSEKGKEISIIRHGKDGAVWYEWDARKILNELRDELQPSSRRQVVELAQFFLELTRAKAADERDSEPVQLSQEIRDRGYSSVDDFFSDFDAQQVALCKLTGSESEGRSQGIFHDFWLLERLSPRSEVVRLRERLETAERAQARLLDETERKDAEIRRLQDTMKQGAQWLEEANEEATRLKAEVEKTENWRAQAAQQAINLYEQVKKADKRGADMEDEIGRLKERIEELEQLLYPPRETCGD